MATAMGDDERRAFLLVGTRTGVLSTVRKDGRPHAAPIWFTLDGDTAVFSTAAQSVKGRNLRRTGQAALTVDVAEPPYSFVSISGHVEISEDLDEMLHWATILGARYMSAAQAEAFGRRNAVPGELLVRLLPDNMVAFPNVAD